MLSDKRLAEMRDALERSKTMPGEHGLTLGEQYMLMREVERLKAGYERVIDAIQAARSNNRLIRPFDERVDNAFVHIINVAHEESEVAE